jgi:hypothetical protein
MWDTTPLSLWLSIHPMQLAVNLGAIPHLAKNERDMATRPLLGSKRAEFSRGL